MTNSNLFSRYGAIVTIGALFFALGFITWANSILIPYFKLICELTIQQALLVTFAFYIGYFLMALPASYLHSKMGYKNGMILGLLLMALGALLFIPAANGRQYIVFLTGLFVQATGLTLLQTAANPYIITLGPIESAASRMSIMGVCGKTAGAIAPLLLIGVLVHNADEIDLVHRQLLTASVQQKNFVLDDLSARLVGPYLVIMAVLLLLILAVKFIHLPEIKDQTVAAENSIPRSDAPLYKHTYMLLGALAIFCAVNNEVLVVDTIIQYAEFNGASFRLAKYFATYALVIMIAGYLAGAFLMPKLISQRNALIFCALWGVALTSFTLLSGGYTSLWCLALLGFGNSLLWPAIWPLSLNGLGRHTSKGSALLIMGVAGAAVGPLVYGWLSEATNQQYGYFILLPCYLFILYFAVWGYKAGRKRLNLPV
ncbi:glucose/galactose MFS transporter [Mucilaginibacter hurinus]|uniref:Glucose/galactose MFS transporter n=1 Tax=Mucilaginibacter hurinus TaxID=2201324 RepID=A0A367GK75_9SPHI|nr:sugar MFS transporter [Mucilaginibacter hurinus]RCH53862.1 glucose/galactose MFS transporter [Mucilaginibacter hurinus]